MELHTLKAIKNQNNSVSDRWTKKNLSIVDEFDSPSPFFLFISILLFYCLLLSLLVLSLLVFNMYVHLYPIQAHYAHQNATPY